MGKAAMSQTQKCIPLTACTNQQLYLNAAEVLSITNKRLYRENRIYRCRLTLRASGITTANENMMGEVYTINNTWTNRKAYAMAMTAWLQAHKDEAKVLKEHGLKAARWRDFKTSLGATNGRLGPMGPKWDASQNLFTHEDLTPTSGNFDWEKATVMMGLPNGTNLEQGFNWLASAGNNFNMVQQLQRIYDVGSEPDASESITMPYDELNLSEDALQDVEMDNLRLDGSKPPYDKEQVDNILAHVGTLGTTLVPSVGASDNLEHMLLQTPWFDAPAGFIILDGPLFADLAGMELCLEVAPGSYKGVDAPQYVDVYKTKDGLKAR